LRSCRKVEDEAQTERFGMGIDPAHQPI
jgi:hypothetical protein